MTKLALQRYLEERRDVARVQAQAAANSAVPGIEGRLDLEGHLDDWERAERLLERVRAAGPAYSGPYEPHSPYGFFSDLSNRTVSPDAARRLDEHRQSRAVGTGAFAGLTIPQYLIDLAAPLVRASRPFVDLIGSQPLPEEGLQANLPKITAGASAASQSAENATVATTDYAATDTAVPVQTIAVRIHVSRQLRDRSGPAGEVLMARDALAAWNAELDRQALNGSGASGEITGVLNTASIQSVVYTDASPTGAELVAKITSAARLAADARKLPMTVVVMAPRRWYWLCSVGAPPDVPVSLEPPTPDSPFVGTIAGMGVLLDGNMPLTLGAGTNEDAVAVCIPEDQALLEPEDGPTVRAFDQTSASTLGVQLELSAPVLFTAARYPVGIGVVTGSGLVAPATW